jgi:FKBP-type peptidyl-prolyl cis-trans isomerase SlyD
MEMSDAQGAALSAPGEIDYLHGRGQILPALERLLEGKGPGESIRVQLEPEDAFGDYDAELLRVEPAERYGDGLTIGMEVEEDSTLYRVTDIADGRAVLDGNHPLAGMALRFSIVILTIRQATPEELSGGVSSS